MFSSGTPLVDGAGDESALLESNTSPETERHSSYKHTVTGE